MQEIYTLARNRIEERLARAKSVKETRKNELEMTVPRIAEIEKEIGRTGLKLIKVGRENDLEYNMLKEKLSNLQEEKNNVMEKAGFPKDYIDDVHICRVCKDKGYVEENGRLVRCSCHHQFIINETYNRSSVSYDKNQTFDNFNIELFEGDAKRKIEYIRRQVNKFIENFDSEEQKNLLFMGNAGTGKTFLTNCITTEIMRAGKTVLYQTAPDMFNNINKFKMQAFNGNNDIGFEFYDYLTNVDLLVIDDLGTESKTASRYAELFSIINTRILNNKKMIISTNLGIENIEDNYDERILSRFIGEFEMYRFDWKDLRVIISMKG